MIDGQDPRLQQGMPSQQGGSPNFRTQPAGAIAPPMQGNIPPAHPQQMGMTAVPVEKTHTWNFSHFSEVEGKQYDGQFSCKKLSIMELSRLGVRKTQLNGGFHFVEDSPGSGIEEHVDGMNSMIAHLEISLLQAPSWFNMEFIYDPEILQAVYREVAKFENSFFQRRRSAVGSGQSSSDDRSGKSEESGASGRVEEVGGGQVQPSMDP